MDRSHKKGREFELEIKKIMEDVIATTNAESRAKVISHKPLMGFSAEWQPDLILMTKHMLDTSLEPSLELAIVECKYISESSSEGTYWTEMSRAYMSLNDLRLANLHLSFYLAVNRNSKNRTRDYSKIFENIGVKFVNVNIPEERSSFEKSLRLLLEQSTSDAQSKMIKHFFEKYR